MAKIVLVEDDADSRNLYKDFLETEGFQIFGAEDGLTGLELARQYKPDLVLCDIILPKIDGYEVLSRLRHDPLTAAISFIFLTAKNTKKELRYGMNLGADDYLPKPFTADDLLEAIAARLQRQAYLKRCYQVEYVSDDSSQETKEVSQETAQFLFPPISEEFREVFEFIEANYAREITLSDVAQAVGYSPAYLTNRVKQETGNTVNRWIIERKITGACSLLETTDWSIEKIATVMGYSSLSYFFRQFRQYRAMTPNDWRKKNLAS
ncbi:response regulator [Cyanothece sp. BG0011]|uniref:response regulator transcription factor n=1 Tax=Cyanothece sp. BG0011 TaxID=2082950 RepID=UPI000D1FA220|nr:response regulator [Cyanothece sp. BG0011]